MTTTSPEHHGALAEPTLPKDRRSPPGLPVHVLDLDRFEEITSS